MGMHSEVWVEPISQDMLITKYDKSMPYASSIVHKYTSHAIGGWMFGRNLHDEAQFDPEGILCIYCSYFLKGLHHESLSRAKMKPCFDNTWYFWKTERLDQWNHQVKRKLSSSNLHDISRDVRFSLVDVLPFQFADLIMHQSNWKFWCCGEGDGS